MAIALGPTHLTPPRSIKHRYVITFDRIRRNSVNGMICPLNDITAYKMDPEYDTAAPQLKLNS